MYEQLYNSTDKGKHDAVLCGLRQEVAPQSYVLIRDYDIPTTFVEKQMDYLALSFLYKTELNTHSRLFMSVWHGIYKRELIKKLHLRFYSEREILSEDLPFQIVFFRNAKSVKFIPYYLYTYCLNVDSLTRHFKLSKFDAARKLRKLLYSLVPINAESFYFIDIEYYGRIRYLLADLLSADNLSWSEKYEFIKRLCRGENWGELKVSRAYERYTWKYMKQYELLKANRSISLMFFILFDKYINKNSLIKIFKASML